ncbi:IS110 family transposase [Aquisalinus luteolus]|uniref:IS110 family transposase n=1 Tax=Aquisalinus luteolus TaxID=1566827 RepID=A0A8J3ESD2_9PROT|nr:IS110 family transposase [Aquisalinus luteolus]GGI02313.1 IS110 family transposase [Aquisalinus luteolus]
MNITTIGLDIGKRSFHVFATDTDGREVVSRKLRRDQVLPFFAKVPPCAVAMEACMSSHYWAREIAALGHETSLIPPAYVKPYVHRQKNDAADAAAICEAATRPRVPRVPAKSADQQADRIVHRTYELLSRQRVGLINALRCHLGEFGIIAPAGVQHIKRLAERVSHPATDLPELARSMIQLIIDQIAGIDAEIDRLKRLIAKRCREDADGQRLLTIPGVGPITASAILAGVPDMARFASARSFAAWLGLVPRQNSTGGKSRLGHITKMGDRTIRQLLVSGATSVLLWARRKPGFPDSWLGRLAARRPAKLAAVALANKLARIIWAVLTKGEVYRPAET